MREPTLLNTSVTRMRSTALTFSSVGMAVAFAQSGNNWFGAAVLLEPESINALGSLNCRRLTQAGDYRSMSIAIRQQYSPDESFQCLLKHQRPLEKSPRFPSALQ
jgi:hypothetical protein